MSNLNRNANKLFVDSRCSQQRCAIYGEAINRMAYATGDNCLTAAIERVNFLDNFLLFQMTVQQSTFQKPQRSQLDLEDIQCSNLMLYAQSDCFDDLRKRMQMQIKHKSS